MEGRDDIFHGLRADGRRGLGLREGILLHCPSQALHTQKKNHVNKKIGLLLLCPSQAFTHTKKNHNFFFEQLGILLHCPIPGSAHTQKIKK